MNDWNETIDAVIISGLIYRTQSVKDFCIVTLDAAISSAAIFFTFGVANMFARILSMNKVPPFEVVSAPLPGGKTYRGFASGAPN